MARILITKGADINIDDDQDKTLVDYVFENDHTEILDLVKDVRWVKRFFSFITARDVVRQSK